MSLLNGNDALLGPEWRDPPPKGGRVDHRESRIAGDFLIMYPLSMSLAAFTCRRSASTT